MHLEIRYHLYIFTNLNMVDGNIKFTVSQRFVYIVFEVLINQIVF